MVGTDGQKNGYEFSYSHKGKIVLGVLPSTRRQLLERTVSILKTTGIHFETPPDIEYALWWKFMVNVGINHTAAILRAPYRHFQTEGPAREIARAGMREVIQIANRKGINLTESDIDKLFDILATFSGDNKVSMLQTLKPAGPPRLKSSPERYSDLAGNWALILPLATSIIMLSDTWNKTRFPVYLSMRTTLGVNDPSTSTNFC